MDDVIDVVPTMYQ